MAAPKAKGRRKAAPKILTLEQRRKKIREQYARPVVVYEGDASTVPIYATRFPKLNKLTGGGFPAGSISELAGVEDSGKAQPLDARLVTPTGFRTMGEIKVGDLVIGADGLPRTVTGVHERGIREVFAVHTNDGASTECCEEHLWFTRTVTETARNAPGQVRSLVEIRETFLSRRGNDANPKMRRDQPNHRIPVTAAVQFAPGPDLPLDPYLLGLLLGDGSFPRVGNVTFHKGEEDLLDAVVDSLPEGDEGNVYPDSNGNRALRIVRDDGRVHDGPSSTKKIVTDLGLLGRDSLTKFIPGYYLTASAEERLELLRGLCDSDGHVAGLRVEYSTSSADLRDGVLFLIRSLGGIGSFSTRIPYFTTTSGERKAGAPSHRILMFFPDGTCPVASKKHLAAWRAPINPHYRRIESVEAVGSKRCRCITIDSPDGLYLTDDFIVTHNSTLACAIAADIQKAAPAGKKHVVLSNFEHRLDQVASWEWWRKLGLDTSEKNFSMFMPTDLGQGIAHAVDLIESREVCCWIIDSVFAAGSNESREAVKAWADPKGKKAAIGIEAKKWGEAWTAIVPLVYDTGTVVIAVNQVREIIELGSFVKSKGGPRMGTPRGRALKFYSWFRFEAYGSQLDPARWGDSDVDGRRIRVKAIKNGINAAPRGSMHLDLIRGEGFDLTGDLIDAALEAGLITGHGSWYSIQEKRVANGMEKLRKLVSESEKLRAWLADGVAKFLEKQPDDASKEDDEAEDGPEVE